MAEITEQIVREAPEIERRKIEHHADATAGV